MHKIWRSYIVYQWGKKVIFLKNGLQVLNLFLKNCGYLHLQNGLDFGMCPTKNHRLYTTVFAPYNRSGLSCNSLIEWSEDTFGCQILFCLVFSMNFCISFYLIDMQFPIPTDLHLQQQGECTIVYFYSFLYFCLNVFYL